MTLLLICNCSKPCVLGLYFEAVSVVKLLQYVIANYNLKGFSFLLLDTVHVREFP